VDITAAVAADLTTLTDTLDDPDLDIADTLRQLATDTKRAVRSYLGLSVMITASGRQFTLTVLESGTEPEDIATSLRLPMPPSASDGSAASFAVLTLYAGHPGGFVDLAADLAWLTGRPLPEVVLDQHRTPPRAPDTPSGLATASLIDQAIGVLIAHGYTPERAHRKINAPTGRLGKDRRSTASDILDQLSGSATKTS
jgi:hypothetical protein